MKDNEQILKKAIEKAVKGGWKYGEYLLSKDFDWNRVEIAYRGAFFSNIHEHEIEGEKTLCDPLCCGEREDDIKTTIFSHDFAKAFWGDEMKECLQLTTKGFYEKVKTLFPTWKYHLQQMVLEAEPLKYIEKFLEADLQKDG